MKSFTAPTTDVQKGLFYIQKNSNTSAYNIVFASRVSGELNRAVLQRAVDSVQSRHDVLQQTFVLEAGVVKTQQNEELAIPVTFEDVAAFDSSQKASHQASQQEGQYEIIAKASQKPFDLESEACVRVGVYQLAPGESVLLIVAHHANFDFWSLALFLDELGYCYENILQAKVIAYDSPVTQFSDHAEDINTLYQSQHYKEALEKRIGLLQGAPTILNLSADYTRPAKNSLSGRSISFSIPPVITKRIQALAKENDVSVYMFLLSAYQVMLHRYTGQNDLLVGSPSGGREKRKLHKTIGNFVNTIVTRSTIEEATTFRALLEQTRNQVVEGIRHQTVAFPHLVEALVKNRDESRTPLVQAYFAWDKLPQFDSFAHFFSKNDCNEIVEWHGLTLSPYWLPQQQGQFDIALEMGAEVNGELTATFKYRDDLFTTETAKGMADTYLNLLNSFCENLDLTVSAVPLLAQEQRQRLLTFTESQLQIEVPCNTIQELFSRQVRQREASIAVKDLTSSYTYRELEDTSNRIAASLRHECQIKPHDRVGVCLDRSKELIAVLLGILKTGASYVPIDPGFPVQRANMVIEDAMLSLLIHGKSENNGYSQNCPHITFDQLQNQGIRQDALPLQVHVTGDSTAYIMFTSGSTGRPKGVAVSHDNVANLLLSFGQYPGFNSADSLLAVTTITFDISVLELFLPLTHGGTTIILDANKAALPDELINCLDHFRPSVMQATPATWKMLFDAGWAGDSQLNVFCGGEALPKSLAARLHGCVKNLYNVYGPTETTIWSTVSHFQGDKITIGYPIANTQTYVLDSNYELVPQGVVGELYIAGRGVSQGYFNRADLTSAAFVANPYHKGLMYRTGDLARLNNRGELECLGRIGNQVKIRGFRIELDDIEENLRALAEINDAVVVAKEIQGNNALVCYYIANGDVDIASQTITLQLKAKLPQYMIPSYFVKLDALPLNSNGKVDKKSLPDVNFDSSEREITEPRTALERNIHALWLDTLPQSGICVFDDFFDIGGHSLIAVQLISKINKQLNLSLDNQFLLSHSTISRMADAIESGDSSSAGNIITLNKGRVENIPVYLMHPIGGTVYCYMALNQYMDNDIPLFAIQSPGIENAEESEVGIEEISEKYVQALLEFQPEGSFILGGWCFGGVLAYETARRLQSYGRDVKGIYVFDTRAPIAANHPDDGDDATLLSWFARDLAVPYDKTLDIPPAELRAMADDQQFNYVLQRAKQIGVVEEDADADKLMNYFEVYIANGLALQMYDQTGNDYQIPVTLYIAQDEAEDYGELLGWDQIKVNQLTTHTIPGTHNSIMYKPLVENLAADLNRKIKIPAESLEALQLEECIA